MELQIISTDKAPAAVGPYSQAIKAGNMIYTSGQIAIVPETGEVIKDDIQEATKQCFKNLTEVLKEAGATLENVVKVTVFVTDINNFSLVNEIYGEYFSNHKPARTLVEISKIPLGGTVEIEAVAIV